MTSISLTLTSTLKEIETVIDNIIKNDINENDISILNTIYNKLGSLLLKKSQLDKLEKITSITQRRLFETEALGAFGAFGAFKNIKCTNYSYERCDYMSTVHYTFEINNIIIKLGHGVCDASSREVLWYVQINEYELCEEDDILYLTESDLDSETLIECQKLLGLGLGIELDFKTLKTLLCALVGYL